MAKITVIGAAGRMGQMHARHLIEMGHEVIGIDLDTPGRMIDDADGVVIATPADLHLKNLAWAVAEKKHAFIEKPLCLIGQSSDAHLVLNKATEQGLVVATAYNLRFHPAVMRVKDAIASGQFKPMWGSFLLRQKPARPLAHFLEEWASHEIDLAMHLMGAWSGSKFFAPMHDTEIRLGIGHQSNAASFIHADAYTDPPRRAFTLVDQDGNSITCDIETDHVQPEHYKAELNAWIHRIETQGLPVIETPLATGWDGLAVIELLERLTK